MKVRNIKENLQKKNDQPLLKFYKRNIFITMERYIYY